MAATKTRDRLFPRTEFTISLAEALALLVDPQEIRPTDTWRFQISDDQLGIVRERAPVDAPPGQGVAPTRAR